MCKILVTCPSLDENVNVNGISSLVRMIIDHNSSDHRYFHFRLGRSDSETKGVRWIVNQITLVPRFLAFVLRNRIDIIHFNTDLTRPSVIRDFILVLVNTTLLRRKSLIHLHGGHMLMAPPAIKSPFFFMIRYMLTHPETRVVLSPVEKEVIRSTYNLDCAVMPNAVTPVRHGIGKDFTGRLSLLYMGRVVRSKGIFLLCDCLEELSAFYDEFDLQIYGPGADLQKFMQRLAAIKGLNYHYNGVAKGPEKELALRRSHIFVLPSLYGEGLPIALLESMNNYCVPVVSDDASIGVVVKDGFNGYLADKGDLGSLKKCLIKVFSDREKLHELSSNARKTIDHSYSLNQYITQLNSLYKSLNQDEPGKFSRNWAEPHHL